MAYTDYGAIARSMNPYGVQQVNGVGMDLGQSGLVSLLLNIYSSRVATLPWVPSDWLQHVRYFQLGDPDKIIQMRVTARADDPTNAPFLDTEAKRAAWAEIAQECHQAYVEYINGTAEAGRQRFQALMDNAAKWDAIGKLADGIAGGFFSGIRALVILAAVGGIAYLYISNPAMFNKFFAGMAKGK